MKNHAKRSLRIAGVVFATVALSALMILTGPFTKIAKADAETSLEEIHKKARLNGVKWCYTGIAKINTKEWPYTGSAISEKSTEGDLEVTTTIESNYSWKDIAPYNSDSDGVYLPNSLAGNKDNDGDVNCYHLFNGGDGMDSIYKVFGKEAESKVNKSSSADARDKFFTNMGYAKKTSGSGSTKKCIRLNYSYQYYEYNGNNEVNRVGEPVNGLVGSQTCLELDSDGKYVGRLGDATLNEDGKSESETDVYLIPRGGWEYDGFEPHFTVKDAPNQYYSPWDGYLDVYTLNDYPENVVEFQGKSWSEITGELNTYFSAANLGGYISKNNLEYKPLKAYLPDSGKYIAITKLSYTVEGDGQSNTVTYELEDGSKAYVKAAAYLSGKSYPEIILTDSDKIVLYQYYLKTLQKGNIVCDDPDAAGEDVTWFISRSEKKNCKIEYGTDGTEAYSYVENPSEGVLHHTANADKILSELNKLTATATTVTAVDDSRYFGAGDGANETAANLSSEATIDSNSAVARDPDCYTATGALGWVVCPIIDSLAGFVESFYEDFVEPNLLIEPELMSPNSSISSGATYQVWSKVRGIANISFFIVLLVVVFSQITGVGINNYGIKKILPKLIIGVLLVNLSYIICQIAVDLSNIIGSSIGSFFSSVMDGVFSNTNEVEITGGVKLAGWGLRALVLVLAGLATGAFIAISGGGWAIVLMLLSGLVSVALAFLSLWAMLCIRKAMVIILVVMSPLAFVCYMLPNMKKTFDFWFKLFKGLLIAYPICSLLVYGGSMVGTILIHASTKANGAGNVGVAISAAIISVVPIFFVPKIVTSSLGALSGIVAKASGSLRKSLSGAATTRLNKGYIGARARMGKAAYDRKFRRREYRASQDVLSGYDKRRDRLNRWANSNNAIVGAAGKIGNRIGNTRLASERRRNMMTEANRGVTGFQRAEEAPEIDAFNLMSTSAISDALTAELNKGEGMDVIRANAAIQALQKKNAYGDLNTALAAAGGSLRNISKRDMHRITDTLLADKKNNAAAGYYAKNLQKWADSDFVDEHGNDTFQSFDQYLSGGGYAGDMQKAGADIISSQDDSALEFARMHAGASGSAMLDHTVQQFMSANGSLDVKQLRQFNEAIGAMNGGMLDSFVGDLSTQQMSNTSFETLSTIGGAAGNASAADIANDLAGLGSTPFGSSASDPGRKAAMEQMAKNYQAARAAEASARAAGNMEEAQGYRDLQKAIIGAATMSTKNGGAFDGIANDANGTFTGSMSGRMKFAMGLSDTLPPVNTGTAAPSGPSPNPNPYGPPLPPPPGPGGNPPFGPGGPRP